MGRWPRGPRSSGHSLPGPSAPSVVLGVGFRPCVLSDTELRWAEMRCTLMGGPLAPLLSAGLLSRQEFSSLTSLGTFLNAS